MAEWISKLSGILPWLDSKLQKREARRTGYYHINHLNPRQRYVLTELCREYEKTGQPVQKDRIYNELFIPSWHEHGQPSSPPGREIDNMLDDLAVRHLIERTAFTVVPKSELIRHLRRIRWL